MNQNSNKFSPEVRERAVSLVQEHQGAYPSLWAAVESIAPKIGCEPQTLLDWVKRVEVDAGKRERLSSPELATLQWMHWFNSIRLLERMEYIPPAEAEARYWRQLEKNSEITAFT